MVNEVAGINNPVLKGNSNLRPETIRTLESVLIWNVTAATQVNLNAFKYSMKNIIRAAPDPSNPGVSLFQNIGSQDGHGLEVEVVYAPSRNLRLSGNYSYQNSKDKSTDKDAGYAPQNHLVGRVD
ncbi:MAG: TonB-dependent receptor [Burkholderiales bacterium]|nr:TonB-dependent receptor [Burkholderiales bacterium]